MSSLPLLSIILLYLLIGPTLSSRPQITQRQDGGFKDYLAGLGRRSFSTKHRLAAMSLNRMESDDEDFGDNWGSGHGETSRETKSILHYFKDIPRSQWSCCLLGRLAGEKDFSCQAQFYRNSNRWKGQSVRGFPHWNWSFRGGFSARSQHRHLALTLQKCVAGRAREFTKCCSSASMERREKHKWHFYHENRVSSRGFG